MKNLEIIKKNWKKALSEPRVVMAICIYVVVMIILPITIYVIVPDDSNEIDSEIQKAYDDMKDYQYQLSGVNLQIFELELKKTELEFSIDEKLYDIEVLIGTKVVETIEKDSKQYITANGTKKDYTDKMKKLEWAFNMDGKSKQYLELYWFNKSDRVLEFLQEYDLGETRELWMELGEKYEIDYILPICIARADSWLGKQLKTAYNIGNVGNTDSWSVVFYDNLEKWIEAIYRTMNNQYLGNIWSIGYLSNGWRKKVGARLCWSGEYCYATSQENWNMNVKNCMSMLHNKPIDEWYIFRKQK